MVEWIESHPYLTGGLVLALVVLFFLLRGSSSSSSGTTVSTVASGPSEALQAAGITAGTSQNIAQIQANAQIAQSNVDLQTAALAAGVANMQTQIGGDVANHSTQAALTLGLSGQGDSTSSILQLLQAQNPTTLFPSWLINGVNANSSNGVPSGGGGGATVVANNPTGGNGTGNPTTGQPFVSTPTMPWPSSASIGGNAPLNDLADSLAQAEHGLPLDLPGQSITTYFGNGTQSTSNACPPGYYPYNGQCLSADSSPGIAGDMAVATWPN
jgi:hypothetical protein